MKLIKANINIKVYKIKSTEQYYKKHINSTNYFYTVVKYNIPQLQMFKYIAKDKQVNLVEFKYKGGTSSITYEHLWSPLAEYLLKFVPMWVAPNLITFIAFAIVVVNHLIFMFAGGMQFGDPIPAWKHVLMGVTILVYQHLDNMDGKQARRTKNSTPVGMLFDHGADAITAVLFGLQIAAVFAVKSQDLCIFMLAYFVLYPNFAGLWNQYSIGHFKLDRINPIDQGLPSYALLAFGGAIFDYQKLNTFHIFANWNEQILLGVGLTLTIIVIKLNRDLFTNDLIRNKQDIIKKVLLPIILVLTLSVWKFIINENVYKHHYYPIVYLLTFFWARNMMLMQVCYVTKQRFHSLNIGTLCYLAVWTGSVYLQMTGHSIESVHKFLIGGAIFQLFVLLEFIFSFLGQAKQVLKIQIFSITPPPELQRLKVD